MDKRTLLLVTFALVFSIAVSAYVSYNRIKSEAEDIVVELAADFSDMERLAAFDGMSLENALARLKAAGITSVALTEDLSINADVNFLSGADPKKINLYMPSKGLSQIKVRLIEKYGAMVVPRIRNSFSLNANSILSKINALSEYDTVIFAEEEVLGYPNYIKETAKAIKASGIKYGYVEFGKQLGDAALSSCLSGNLVKVHSIPADEMENLSRDEMVQRYLRAARERSIRILYVHLLAYPDNGKDLIQTNERFIKKIKDGLSGAGFKVGKASSPINVSVSRMEKGLMGFGIAGGLILLLSYFMSVNYIISIILMAFFAVLPAKVIALVSAVVFPAYAVISQFPAKRESSGYGYVSRSVSAAMYIAGITAVGAILVESLLADRIGMLGVEGFSGVKLAFIFPIIIVAAYFFLRGENGKLDIKSAVFKLNDLLSLKITMFHVVLLLTVAAAGALMILRSGNFGVPLPGAEKFARGLLENALNIRPRTKEFLLGYPAIILAAIYYYKGGNKWLWLWLSVAVLAPISMINSFCHIHTPLIISVVRSCVGLVMGIALGLLIYVCYTIGMRSLRSVNK